MAKEEEKKEDKKEEKKEKQVPEKPRRSGDISFMQILIIIGGTVVLLFVLFFFGYKFIIKPDLQGGSHTEQPKKEEPPKPNAAELEKSLSEEESYSMEDIEAFKKKENERFMTTGRITTNPKGSTQFVVIDLALDFRVNEESAKEIKKEKIEESPGVIKPLAEIKGTVTNTFGSMGIDEIQGIPRDSLQKMFKEKLKPVFKRNKLFLKEVILQEFIIQ